MKNRLTIAVMLLLSTLIFACKKFDQNTVTNNYYLQAQKNDVLWEATQGAYFVSSNTLSDTLTFLGSKDQENLYMVVYKNTNGEYKIDFTKTKFYTTDQSAISSSYLLDNTASNVITLNITTLNQPISGNFNLTFKKTVGNDTFPGTVVFTQGTFLLARAVLTQ